MAGYRSKTKPHNNSLRRRMRMQYSLLVDFHVAYLAVLDLAQGSPDVDPLSNLATLALREGVDTAVLLMESETGVS